MTDVDLATTPRARRLITLVLLLALLAVGGGYLRLTLTGELERWQAERLPTEALGRRAAAPGARFPTVVAWATRLEREGRHEEAARAFARAADLRPALPEPWLGWGRCAFAAGRWREAEAILDRTVALWPNLAGARFVRAALLHATWRKSAARQELRAGLRRDPLQPLAWGTLADLQMEAGNPLDAARCYRQAVELVPAAPYLRSRLGAALLQLDRPAEAARQNRMALKMDPADLDARYYLGVALARSGRDEDRAQALVELNRVVSFSANKARPWVAAARIWIREGELGDAAQALEHALDQDPNNREAVALLVDVCRRGKRDAEALRFERELRRVDLLIRRRRALERELEAGRLTSARFLDLAPLLLSLGDARGARAALNAAEGLDPRNPRVRIVRDRLFAAERSAGHPGRLAPPPGP